MKLYFSNLCSTITTLMIVALLMFIGYSIHTRESINSWGIRILALFFFGLVICCFTATRDGLDKTIQSAIDNSCSPGIFSLISLPTIIGAVCAVIIIIASIVALITKSQNVREILFYIISSSITVKILTIEISRIIMCLKK